ncbi:hypothetical protein [Streptomyces sp. YU58]|uniref:hypothetical protein n=1 Tax=Streptomyces sp. SX92 TaxID=3158972 RepID=UPI0027B912A4|nr:hypothetical protein [Streptomyces coralus]WLW52246.1 hypothetical protein QU709_13005 [Streptomyces coralus]
MPGDRERPVLMFRHLFITAVLLLLLLVSLTACSSGGDPPEWKPPSATAAPDDPLPPPPATDKATAPPPATDAVEDTALPPELVGAWESNEGTGTIAYRFMADGRYLYAGILATPTPDGVVQITLAAEGTAATDGDTLLLEPTRYTISREDPGDPAGDYTDRPGDLTPEQHTWELPAADVLALTSEDGVRVTLRRPAP